MRVEDLNSAAINSALGKLLAALLADLDNIDEQSQQDILEAISMTLDDLDCDDTFGTEGWEHRYGFED